MKNNLPQKVTGILMLLCGTGLIIHFIYSLHSFLDIRNAFTLPITTRFFPFIQLPLPVALFMLTAGIWCFRNRSVPSNIRVCNLMGSISFTLNAVCVFFSLQSAWFSRFLHTVGITVSTLYILLNTLDRENREKQFQRYSGATTLLWSIADLLFSVFFIRDMQMNIRFVTTMGIQLEDAILTRAFLTYIAMLLGAGLIALTGIITIRRCTAPQKPGLCLATGIAATALNILRLYTLVSMPEYLIWLVPSLLLPILCIAGALWNKHARQQQADPIPTLPLNDSAL